MTEGFREIARTEAYPLMPLMAELESQSLCPRFWDCELVRQYGVRRCCDDFGDYCLGRNKEDKPSN